MVQKIDKDSDSFVDLNPDTLSTPLPSITSGSLVLDNLIGGVRNSLGVRPCRGFPKGRITQMYGVNSCGKTTVSLEAVAAVCRGGGAALYVDFEHEVDPHYAAYLGVPVTDRDRFLLSQPNSMEEGLIQILGAAEAGVDIVVIDSVGAAVPKASREMNKDKAMTGRLGACAAGWSAFLPKFKPILQRSGMAVIAISQMRATLASMGPQSAPQGGEGWKFYSSLRVHLKMIGKIQGKWFNPATNSYEDAAVANKIRATLEKCKVSGNAMKSAEYYLKGTGGIDNLRSVIDLGLLYGIIERKGAWYTWPDRGFRANGAAELMALVESTPGVYEALYETVDSLLSEPSKRGASITQAASLLSEDSETAPEDFDLEKVLEMADRQGQKALAEGLADDLPEDLD